MPYDSKRILKALSDGREEIDVIHAKTQQIEIKIMPVTLLELGLTGTVENVGDQIYISCYRAGHYCLMI